MRKADIVKQLNALGFNQADYWVITGSAMVLYGLREQTHDIDLGCTTALADRLEAQGTPVEYQADGSRKLTIGGDVELFENWLFDTVQLLDGIPVISLKGLSEMKTRLGREKDLRDLRLISDFLAQK